MAQEVQKSKKLLSDKEAIICSLQESLAASQSAPLSTPGEDSASDRIHVLNEQVVQLTDALAASEKACQQVMAEAEAVATELEKRDGEFLRLQSQMKDGKCHIVFPHSLRRSGVLEPVVHVNSVELVAKEEEIARLSKRIEVCHCSLCQNFEFLSSPRTSWWSVANLESSRELSPFRSSELPP